MKHSFIKLIMIMAIPVTLSGQSRFQKVYPAGAHCNYGTAMQGTDNGYFFVASDVTDIYVFKTDSAGYLKWQKRFDLGGDEGVYRAETTEKGIVICGYSIGSSTFSRDPVFIHLDTAGNVIQLLRYDQLSVSNAFHSVRATSDKGFILSGRSAVGTGSYSMLLTKLDSIGGIEWSTTFGGGGWEWGHWAEQTDDGGYILVGEADGFGAGYSDVYLVRTDAQGNKIWSRYFGGNNSDAGYCVKQTPDGGFMISGRTLGFDVSNLNPKAFLLKTDSLGNVLWMKTYRQAYEFTHFSLLPDGGSICLGYISLIPGVSLGQNDLVAMRTDSAGNVMWARVYGGVGGESSGMVLPVSDGGFILSGLTQSFITVNSQLKPYMVKTDSAGISGCNENAFTPLVLTANPSAGPVTETITSGLSFYPNTYALPSVNISYFNICCNITPVAAFTVSPVSGNSFSFTNQTLSGSAVVYHWDFGDGSSSTLDNPVHTYSSPGTYTVCLTATNECGNAQACSTVTITTSVADMQPHSLSPAIQITSKDNLMIVFAESGLAKITITNSIGMQVWASRPLSVIAERPVTISVAHLPSGIYMLSSELNGVQSIKRFALIR